MTEKFVVKTEGYGGTDSHGRDIEAEWTIIETESGEFVAHLGDDTGGYADLLATAPDMYEALQPFAARCTRIKSEGDTPLKVLIPFEWLEQAAYVLSRADNAIAKAEATT